MTRWIMIAMLAGCATPVNNARVDPSIMHPLNAPLPVRETWRCQLQYTQMSPEQQLDCQLLGIRSELNDAQKAQLRQFMRRVVAHDLALPSMFPDDFKVTENE